jgi:AhpD family alkylhydroperoxidase
MKNPATRVPKVMQAAYALGAAVKESTLPAKTLKMIHLRASQINNCGFCVDMHAKELQHLGESMERIFSIAAWRDTPYYDEPERAVLALTESATRLADRPDAVPDDVWNEARKHFDEDQITSILLNIAMINFWNRLTVSVRQVAGTM